MADITISLSVRGYAFFIPKRYSAGQTISEAEAGILNREITLRTRNVFEPKLEERLANILPLNENELASWQHQIFTYAKNYSFPALTQKYSADPITREAHKIASAELRKAMNAKGLTLEAMGKNAYEAKLTQIMANPKIIAEATRRIQETQSIADELLSGEV